MNEIIKVNGWELHKSETSDEALIADVDLAIRLKYTKPENIRTLIKRMIAAGQLGVVFTVQTTSGSKGGRKGVQYFLTKHQAIKVIARSETEVADQIMDEIAQVFVAYQEGRLVPAPAKVIDNDARFAQLAEQQVRILDALGQMMQTMMQRLTLPAPSPAQTYDPAFDESRVPPASRQLSLVKGAPRPHDRNGDGRWEYLAKVADSLGVHRYDVAKVCAMIGIFNGREARLGMTRRGNRAWLLSPAAVDQLVRYFNLRGA